jgi:acetyl-CoA carboxylase carboxyl transferase subunit alpha
MDVSERIIFQRIEEARDKIFYIKEIDIGIPPGKIEELENNLRDAEDFAHHSNKSSIAKSKLSSFNSIFGSIEDEYFSNLTPRQIDSISRSDQRPTTLDYAREVFEGFEELKGFEANSSDPAVVCGFAKLDSNEVMIIGHEKGAFHEDYRRGGSALPQGNYKAIQAMQLAERFNVPVISFIDTPGSWPLEEFLPSPPYISCHR